MTINYGSFAYFMYIFIALFACLIIYLVIKNKSIKVKRTVIFIIALLNFLQHILKRWVYPQYRNGDFSLHLSSAYNMCAFLIIISPFIILFGNELLKNFLTYVGSFAGMIAIIIPYWFIGKSAFSYDAYRFYLCHSLLFISSILPTLVGLHKIKYRHFWKIGILFIISLGIIIINDVIFIKIGQYYPLSNPSDIYASLKEINPCWSIAPPENKFKWLVDIISIFTPSVFLGNNPSKIYVPILWYAIPVYIGITSLSFIIGILIDNKGFKIRKYRKR